VLFTNHHKDALNHRLIIQSVSILSLTSFIPPLTPFLLTVWQVLL
jgi:hypothetical protein